MGVNAVDQTLLEVVVQALVQVMSLLALLPVWAQWLVLGLVLALALIPHIAPHTPWTWDDHFIAQQPLLLRVLALVWNVVSANYGRAANRGTTDASDDDQPRG